MPNGTVASALRSTVIESYLSRQVSYFGLIMLRAGSAVSIITSRLTYNRVLHQSLGMGAGAARTVIIDSSYFPEPALTNDHLTHCA